MKLELRELRTQDHKKAIQFAIKGMHFDWYMDSKFLLNLYGRYFGIWRSHGQHRCSRPIMVRNLQEFYYTREEEKIKNTVHLEKRSM